MCTFSVFDWKYPFWANLAQKIKIANLGQNKKILCLAARHVSIFNTPRLTGLPKYYVFMGGGGTVNKL